MFKRRNPHIFLGDITNNGKKIKIENQRKTEKWWKNGKILSLNKVVYFYKYSFNII